MLEALEKVGDAAALPAVQTLANLVVTTPIGRRVQAAARKCLPILRERVLKQEPSNTLLRASSAGGSPEKSLLRPTQGGNTDTPEQLLRAAYSEQDGT